ncbi:hypothetical protein DH2020_043035 [Rehmannia glutinosa]|uniref:Uncharacterized protein n=1 Tax=Rehmannia glutinosa TaxID=99300 RepID=A0ABR0ULQ1_REHGL
MATNTNAMSRLELTPWDLQFLQLDPIQKGILFYKPESQKLQKTIIDRLKNSFSRTLAFFPPLAGRLGTVAHDDNTTCFFVDCNNAGAEFIHAIADTVSVSDIFDAKYIPEIVSSFFPLNGIPNCEGISKPLLGVQFTELVDGYFIGCTANHAVKNPLINLEYQKPPLLQRVYHFSKKSVAKLKAKANSEASSNKISSLQAVSSHLWRSVVRCRHLQNIHNNNISSQEAYFNLLVGARARIPLPEGYFGNGAFIAGTAIGETEVLQNGLGYAGLKINELVSQQSRENVVKFVEDWVKNPKVLRRGGLTYFLLASSPRHNVYGTDFGWGKPIAVRSGKGQKFDGKMTVFPAAEAGGIDIEVCLAPETLRAIEDDAEFMEGLVI